MIRCSACLACLAGLVVWGPPAPGQDTATPSVPATAVPIPPAEAAAAAGAQKGGCLAGLGSLCGLAKSCKANCCDSPLGQLLNNAVKPFGMMTGGIVPDLCPSSTDPSDSKQGKSSPSGSAADKIKRDQAEAKARRAAVRYLGTVDCHYYPEAEKALIASLRADRVECVRWEAAQALGSGCCCTKKTIEALTIAVTGSDKDGNPAETSPRVKAAAYGALQQCLARCPEGFQQPDERLEYPPQQPAPTPEVLPAPEPQRPELPPSSAGQADSDASGVRLVAYYAALDRKPTARVIAEARQALAALAPPAIRSPAPPSGKRSLLEIWEHSAEPMPERPSDPPFPAALGPERISQTPEPEQQPTRIASRPEVGPTGPYPRRPLPPYSPPAPSAPYRPPYYEPSRPAPLEGQSTPPAPGRPRWSDTGPMPVQSPVRPAGWNEDPRGDPITSSRLPDQYPGAVRASRSRPTIPPYPDTRVGPYRPPYNEFPNDPIDDRPAWDSRYP